MKKIIVWLKRVVWKSFVAIFIQTILRNCVEDGKIAPVCDSTNFEKKAKSTQLLQVHTNLTKNTILVHLKKTIVQFTMKPWIVWLTHWKKEKSEEEYHPSSSKENYRKIYYEALDWLYVLVMSRTRFRVAWMSRNSFLKAGAKSEV